MVFEVGDCSEKPDFDEFARQQAIGNYRQISSRLNYQWRVS